MMTQQKDPEKGVDKVHNIKVYNKQMIKLFYGCDNSATVRTTHKQFN